MIGTLLLATVAQVETALGNCAYVARVRDGHIVTIVFLPNRERLAKRLVRAGRAHVIPELNVLVDLPDLYLTTDHREADLSAVEALTRLPRIQEIGLGRLPVGRSWLNQLSKLPHLKSLDLSFSELANKDSRLICDITSLEYLRLDQTDQHVEFLFHLSRHTGLKQLELNELRKKPPVRVLARFDNLDVLSVAWNGFSDVEIKELGAALPNVTLRSESSWKNIDISDLQRLSLQVMGAEWICGPIPTNGVIKREGGQLMVMRQ